MSRFPVKPSAADPSLWHKIWDVDGRKTEVYGMLSNSGTQEQQVACNKPAAASTQSTAAYTTSHGQPDLR